MTKYAVHAFHSLMKLIGLAAFAAVANAQSSSLSLRHPDGQTVVFSHFGTIDYHPNQNPVSRGYEVVYNAGSGVQRAWVLNNQRNSGIIPVSLSADQPNGYSLRDGEEVNVRAVTQTFDDKLKFTFRYILQGGSPRIETIVTIESASDAPIEIVEMSILSPPSPQRYERPCDSVREFDGAILKSFLVTVAPNVIYRKTKAVWSSPLSRGEARDLPGCDAKPGVVPIN